MSGLIWIQSVCYSDGIPERIFFKKNDLKKISRRQYYYGIPKDLLNKIDFVKKKKSDVKKHAK